jgi:probable HAF family extracellular repeat protein
VITDLGVLPGDAASAGLAINNKSQIVGGFVSRAFIWQNGLMTDLNTLVPGPPFSPLYLLAAESINDLGEITGTGLAINGDQHAFLAIPCDGNHAGVAGCQDGVEGSGPVTTSEAAPASPAAVSSENRTPRTARRRMPGQIGDPRFPGHRLPVPGMWPMR